MEILQILEINIKILIRFPPILRVQLYMPDKTVEWKSVTGQLW